MIPDGRHDGADPSGTMRRTIERLGEQVYDVVIVGGGIHGAWAALDAARRGLGVALLEKSDFGSGTSANSQKIIHGGLRYLQHADLARMRESIRERRNLLRVAPHFVHPLPFVIPCYRGRMPRSALALALTINDLVGFDRNRLLPADRMLPASRLISRDECLAACPGLDRDGLTGGAIFYDAQVHHPNRMIIAILRSAVAAGADLVNYAEVRGLLSSRGTVTGVRGSDGLDGRTFNVRARVVLNCAGPWTADVLGLPGAGASMGNARLFKAVVLVTRPIVGDAGVGVPSRSPFRDQDALVDKGPRYLFITPGRAPGRDTSLIGTFDSPFSGRADRLTVTEVELRRYLEQINAAYPGARLARDDIYFVHTGLLPAASGDDPGDGVRYPKRARIIDHGRQDGPRGLISVIGLKYTTARAVAERALDLVVRALGTGSGPCRTAAAPIHGAGAIAPGARQTAGPSAEAMQHLVRTHGAAAAEVLRSIAEEPRLGEPLSKEHALPRAAVVHAVRAEMARTLADVIFRRTELGLAGYPGDACVHACADLMASELGWDDRRRGAELRAVTDTYSRLGCYP